MKVVLCVVAVIAAALALIFRPPNASGVTSAPMRPSPTARRRIARPVAAPSLVVYVAGEVSHPGVYTLALASRAADALARAGGAKADADLVAVNLAAPLRDGDEIAVPKIGAAVPRARRSPRARNRSPHPARSRRNAAAAFVPLPPHDIDINTADATVLESLPGVGSALAERIIAYRETNGPFASVDELADVSGISSHLLDTIAPYLTAGA